MTFERIVRPFQTVQVAPLPQGATVLEPNVPLPPITLVFGQSGDIKSLNGSGSSESTAFTDDKMKETKRETVVKRVENPDDSSQYVNVENPKKIEMESGKADTFKRQEMEFNDEG